MYEVGTLVEWKWANGRPQGIITEVYTEKVVKQIKGATITRNGSPERPAYYIVQENGNSVLKLHTEIKPV